VRVSPLALTCVIDNPEITVAMQSQIFGKPN
jgi:hypothetical protein